MTINEEIKALEAELIKAEIDIADLRCRIHDAKCKMAGVKEGDVVKWTGPTGKDQEVMVAKIEFWGIGKPWIYGHQKTKSGGWSASRRYVGLDWSKE